MTVDSRCALTLPEVITCLADVLERRPEEVDPDATLTSLGLNSFTAIRLRRRLLDHGGTDLSLSSFLGPTTPRTLAACIVIDKASPVSGDDGEPCDVPSHPQPDTDEGDPSFPLTPIQAAYFVGRDPAFPLGGVATYYYSEFDRFPVGRPEDDLAALGAAWNRLVRRHPMLRVVIGPDARQRILEEVPDYEIAAIDLRGDPASAATLAGLRERCSHQVRPVDSWPLFDLRAALLPDGRSRLFVGFDVLALDLMSWMRLMHEWGSYVADPRLTLPAPPITFAELLRKRLNEPEDQRRREADAAYWARRAPALPPGPALPWERKPAEIGVPRFARHEAEMACHEWALLSGRAAVHGLTPTGLLLAAFALVLQRWGTSTSFCLNTTLFDRDDVALGDDLPGLDSVVGDFTTTILVEVPSADAGSWSGFASYAAAVNRRFWTDMDHRYVSGVEALPRVTDPLTGLPVPQHPVVFTSGVGLTGGECPTAWLGSEVFGVSQTPQVLLDHIVLDTTGSLRIAWDAVEGALPEGFVDGMRDAHLRLLHRLAADADAWADPTLGWDPTFVTDEELPTGAFGDPGPLLDDPLRAAAERGPASPALLDGANELCAGELSERTTRIGRLLAGLGVGPGDLVGIFAEKGILQVTGALGILASGAGYVPVEPSWPMARIASLAVQAGIAHVLASPEVDASSWPQGVIVHRLTANGNLSLAAPAVPGPIEPRRAAPDDLAYAIFTSGSTGKPKGVAIEHRAVRTTLDDLALRFPLHQADRVISLSAFSFDLSVYDIFSVLGEGAAVVLPDAERQRDPGHWLELMAQHRVTIWNTAPALLEMLVEYSEMEPDAVRSALATLRLVFLSADWIPVTLPDRLRELAPQAEVVSLGGATEASIWSICFPIGTVDPKWRSIPYGRALRGQSFHVLDNLGRPCSAGVTGELYIGGDGLARGYLDDPAQTAERFVMHPVLRRRLYRTGDLGRWRSDGTLEFLGRMDRQVKIRGHRIELGEIESTLDRHPEVRHVVAQAVPGPDDRPRLVCYFVPTDPAAPPSHDELADVLRASLPPFMVPNRFVMMDALPITSNGKIDYKALASPYKRKSDSDGFAVQDHTGPSRAATGSDASGTVGPRSSSPGLGPATGDAVITDAVDRGLQLRLIVSAGSLAPVDALHAAADWARAVGTAVGQQGRRPIERVPVDGLIELILDGNIAAEPAGARTEQVVADRPVLGKEPSLVGGSDPQVERAVARVFSELLNCPVEVTTPFFRLGASSLTLVLAHRALRAELDADLTVVDLFTRPTVRELATFITARREAPAPPGAAATAVAGTKPLDSARPADVIETNARPSAAARRISARARAGLL